MRFIFFTKTIWEEPPRLRHQLAKLLAKDGHAVEFFELPVFPWQSRRVGKSGEDNIQFHSSRQLIHHKLRLNPFIHHLNAIYERIEISAISQVINVHADDVIINFNYDYFFLKSLFPGNRLITIINDDFWSRAICGYEKPLLWALKRTCDQSDRILTVSPPLKEQLDEYCISEIFLPWTDAMYITPSLNPDRNILLFWGYIGEKINYSYVLSLADSFLANELPYFIHFVGPFQKNDKSILKMQKHSRIKIYPACPLEKLHLNNVLASFIPYQANVRENDAISLPNKTLHLLSRGLPPLITGMPHFIKEPFVFRLTGNIRDDLIVIDDLKRNFHRVQPSIERFVSENSSKVRLKTFLDIVDSCLTSVPLKIFHADGQ